MVCKWCYPKSELEDLCVAGKGTGLVAREFLRVRSPMTSLAETVSLCIV